jgi:ATP-dependent RNA helicase DeaD
MALFEELPLHPLVAGAIAQKGFSEATPVQSLVVAPEHAGRDLLVSSRTGSGKTLAFGVLIADNLLAPEEDSKVPRIQGAPRALVVAPTRELANQVGRELEWLLRPAKVKIATCTGGTSVVGDLRALRARVDVVVGTPGRLLDLHKRGVLNLAGVATLVLDEADEMLDLGFQEDLEYLLGHAPAERRTLLFSATIPSAIARIASKYQKNAVRVDARGKGDSRKHEDITFEPMAVQTGDRLGAVINIILCGGTQSRAIVFCRTRDRVAELHEHLTRMGIRASAIAGDRAQNERDRALAALRNGDVQVMVATDVAARGLDLPDVDRVIHGDLPDNEDSLAHRSGRTGRAGRKGTSFVIAESRERRKAERMMHMLGVKAEWKSAPDQNDVRRHLEGLIFDDLMKVHAAQTAPPEPTDETAKPAKAAKAQKAQTPPTLPTELLERLRTQMSDSDILTMLLGREMARMPTGYAITPVIVSQDKPRPAVTREQFQSAVVFRVSAGHEQRVEARWLLPTICDRGGITKNEIGAIRIGKSSSVFEIAPRAAGAFEAASAKIDPENPRMLFVRIGTGRADDFVSQTHSHREPDAAPRERAPREVAAPRERAPREAAPSRERAPREHRPHTEAPHKAPVHAKPAHPKAEHAKPAHPKAEHAKPAHPKAEHAKPAHPKTDHFKPGHPKPMAEKNAAAAVSHPKSRFDKPKFGKAPFPKRQWSKEKPSASARDGHSSPKKRPLPV